MASSGGRSRDFAVVDWQALTPALMAEWRALLQGGDLHLSLSPEWVSAAAAAHGRLGDVRFFIGHSEGTLFGVIPFMVERIRICGVRLTALQLAGNIVSYHHELVAPGREAELLEAWLASRDWDVFVARGLNKGGASARAIAEVGRRRGSYLVRLPGERSPYIPITSSWEDFLASQSRNFRSNLTRKERRLAAAGMVEERWFRSGADVADLLDCMLTVEAGSWKANAGIAIGGRPAERDYYRLLLPLLADSGHLAANALYLDGTPVAYHLCYSCRGRVGNLKTSFQEPFQELSPGAVVIARAIRKAFEEGAREFDFHGGSHAHKLLWTQCAREHETLFLFSRSVKACAVGAVKTVTRFIASRRGDPGEMRGPRRRPSPAESGAVGSDRESRAW